MGSGAIRIGLLYSTSGPYRTIGRAMLNGALLALEQVNADPALPFTLEPVVRDPGGRNDRYAELARWMLADQHLVHVVGCYTSSSRKEVLPFFEKHDGLLWYPSHYEGFESSENVIYTGAAPNQHIVPLADYMLGKFGRSAYLVGSNYIWAWENNKIMREAVQDAGGEVVVERYLPVGETDVSAIVAQVLDRRPSFVFNTLIGDSAYAFFRRIRQVATARRIDQPELVPIASCSLAEPELVEIGADAADGHISSSVYFESVAGAVNAAFVKAYRARFPNDGPTSADVEASYIAVQLLARALQRAATTDMHAVRSAILEGTLHAPQGRVHIDPDNRHCYLTPRIGISNRGFGFNIIYEADGPVKPDPYLVWSERQQPAASAPGPQLRLVK